MIINFKTKDELRYYMAVRRRYFATWRQFYRAMCDQHDILVVNQKRIPIMTACLLV